MKVRERKAMIRYRQVRVSRNLLSGMDSFTIPEGIARSGSDNLDGFAQSALKSVMIHGIASVL